MTTITNLIIALNCNSVKDRYNNLLEFIMLNPNTFDANEIAILVNCYKTSQEKKVEEGKRHAAKRWHKANSIEGGEWIFIAESRFGTRCHKCKQRYEIGDSVFVRKPENKGFHIACTPESVLTTNEFYLSVIANKDSE